MVIAKLTKTYILKNIYLDTRYSISLANRAWIKECIPDIKVRKIVSLIIIRGLGLAKY